MNTTPHHKRSHYTDCLQSLQMACEWLSINRGRSTQYSKLIREFFAEEQRSREHILAYSESCEIIDIYELWEAPIKHFSGLERKIKAVLSKGPILREDENPAESTNRPRNDAFVFLLAGKLLRAGIKVVAVEGTVKQGVSCYQDADITFDYNGLAIDIQCKRPQTQAALTERIQEAHRQLSRTGREGQKGIIAIDCSPFIRPPEQLLEAESAQDAEKFLGHVLQRILLPEANVPLGADMLGFLGFARAPAMIREEYSAIVSSRGNPVTYIRPDCITTWVAIPGPRASGSDALRFIFERLHGAMHSN